MCLVLCFGTIPCIGCHVTMFRDRFASHFSAETCMFVCHISCLAMPCQSGICALGSVLGLRAYVHASRVSHFHLIATDMSVAEVHSCWCKSIMHCVCHFNSQHCVCQVVCQSIVYAMLHRALCMPSHSIAYARLYVRIAFMHVMHIALCLGQELAQARETRDVSYSE